MKSLLHCEQYVTTVCPLRTLSKTIVPGPFGNVGHTYVCIFFEAQIINYHIEILIGVVTKKSHFSLTPGTLFNEHSWGFFHVCIRGYQLY